MESITDLQPKLIWKYFEKILQIPRPSKHEEKIISYLIEFAKYNNLSWKKDTIGNVLITKPASPGFENKETLVMQSHMDMVCEKNSDVTFDFHTEGIQAYIEEGWIKARGTTLGADNGIGIAAQLAVLADKSLKHGAVECLFTVDEETGLTGAFELEPGFFTGKYLLNLDSEDDGEIFMGCAGGVDTIITYPIFLKTLSEGKHEALHIRISGLKGGHSGDDINKGHGNANKLLVRLLWNLMRRYEIKISKIQGGNLRNAIPREAQAVILVNQARVDELKTYIADYEAKVYAELQPVETGFKLNIEGTKTPDEFFEQETMASILSAIYACPNGVVEMSRNIPNFVETSTNLASINIIEDKEIRIVTSQRSSSESSKEAIAERIRSQFELIGAKVEHSDGYPGWNPNPDSALLKIAQRRYLELFGSEPLVRAIHAGLECGLFLEKYPYLDMISFGPTIRGAHSPDERMEIHTVEKFWKLLLSIMAEVPEKER